MNDPGTMSQNDIAVELTTLAEAQIDGLGALHGADGRERMRDLLDELDRRERYTATFSLEDRAWRLLKNGEVIDVAPEGPLPLEWMPRLAPASRSTIGIVETP